MASLKSLIIFSLCCVLVVKSDGSTEKSPPKDGSSPLVSIVLDYLNSNPNKIYNYRRGALLSAQDRADVVEISVEVEADCDGNIYPEIPCDEHTLICHAFMGRDPIQADKYHVLSNVMCSPRVEITVEDMDDNKSVVPMVFGDQNLSDGKIDLSHEAMPPEQGNADFVAIRRDHVPCLGCPFDLNKDAEGVDELIDTALQHIESERKQRHNITNVRRLQQQVVAGLKYILLADVAQTTCSKDADISANCIPDMSVEPFVCEITFIEQPWITKNKRIIKNNCTLSQEFEPVRSSRQENEIMPLKDPNEPSPDNPKANYHGGAKKRYEEEPIDSARLADLESQILFGDMFEAAPTRNAKHESMASPPNLKQEVFAAQEPLATATDMDSLQVEPLSNKQPSYISISLLESMPIIDEVEPPEFVQSQNNVLPSVPHFMEYDLIYDRLARELNGDSDSDSIGEKGNDKREKREVIGNKNDTSEESDSNSSSDEKPKKPKAQQVDIEPRAKDPQEEIIETTTLKDLDVVKREIANNLEDSSSSESNDIKKTRAGADQDSSSSSSSSEDDEKNNIPTSKPKTEYYIKGNKKSMVNKADDTSESSSSESEDTPEEERRSKRYFHYLSARQKRSIGQLEKISPDEKVIVRDLADFAAATLDNIDDDHHKRVILQILGAKKLKLDGIYYQIILRLGISQCQEHEHQENCREKLFTNLTKICKVQVHVEDDYSNPKVVKSQCQNIKKDENDRNRTNYSRYRRAAVALAGGIRPIATDHPDVQKFLSATLQNLDSVSDSPNKHKTVKVISASYQVVAGARVIIKAEIGLSDCRKSEDRQTESCALLASPEPETCTVDVWDRSWLNKTVYRVRCNDKSYTFGNEIDSREKREVLTEMYNYKPVEKVEESLSPVKLETAFKQFTKHYNKLYKGKIEYNFRLKVFRDNLNRINLLNKYEKGTAIYGITRFADLTEKEFSRGHGYRTDLRNENELPFTQAKIPDIQLPPEFDWRTKGAVTEVKNQGLCGSCWAFSVTGNVEGQYAIAVGKLLEFSEQELVDCDKTDEGCNGGLMDNAYRAIEKLGGLESESDYPYDGDDETCKFNPAKVEVQLSGAVNISHNETDMAKWLVSNGPISIAINANAMQFYMGGVSHPWRVLCNPNNLDHGVLIVGYGVHKYSLFNKTIPYWVVKNSWGESWGEQGYYRVYRGDGTCGLNQTPSSAIIA